MTLVSFFFLDFEGQLTEVTQVEATCNQSESYANLND